jgi:hypothetical protein
MLMSTLIQIVAACTGVIGSMFFAIGVMRQTVAAMADLSGTYFDWNPHMVPALAAQKADYIFGGGIIVLAFALQLIALLVSPGKTAPMMLSSGAAPWIAIAGTALVFFLLRLVAKRVSRYFEKQIWARLKEKDAVLKRELEERQRAMVQK